MNETLSEEALLYLAAQRLLMKKNLTERAYSLCVAFLMIFEMSPQEAETVYEIMKADMREQLIGHPRYIDIEKELRPRDDLR